MRRPPREIGEQRADLGSAPSFPRAVGADREDPHLVELGRQEPEQQQRGQIGRMHIVEDDHQRAARGCVAQKLGDRVEEIEAGVVRIEARRSRRVGQSGEMRLQLGHQLADVDRAAAELQRQDRGILAAHVRSENLHPRPVGRLPAAFPRVAPEHARFPSCGEIGHLLRQPRLADAGLAGEQEQASAAGYGFLEAGGELGELALAANEESRRHAASLGRGVSSVARTRIRYPLSLLRPEMGQGQRAQMAVRSALRCHEGWSGTSSGSARVIFAILGQSRAHVQHNQQLLPPAIDGERPSFDSLTIEDHFGMHTAGAAEIRRPDTCGFC